MSPRLLDKEKLLENSPERLGRKLGQTLIYDEDSIILMEISKGTMTHLLPPAMILVAV